MDKKFKKKVLVLAPHADDGELGAGAYMHNQILNGCEVLYIAFSRCEKSLPSHLEKDILEKECLLATSILGISNVEVLNFDVRVFDQYRQEILDKLIKIKKTFNPDEILTPSTKDIHQDHMVITQEAKRAFKNKTILGYELPWNCFTSQIDYIVEVRKDDIQKKCDAISHYKSQNQKSYTQEEYIFNLAKFRGSLIDVEYAEVFEIIRLVQILK